MPEILGIHHMSAICGPAQENLDFYCGVLGLRLLKMTVNYDDPGAYHLYYGDGVGTPGTLLTFFPYPSGYPGRTGKRQATVTSLAIPREATSFWVDRFRQHDVEFDKPHNRDGGQYIGFRAPDGLPLELAAVQDFTPAERWPSSHIPASRAIGAMKSITLVEESLEPTEALLTEVLGFERTMERENRVRFQSKVSPFYLEIVVDPSAPEGRGGHGSVHHVAFRTPDEESQTRIREALVGRGYTVSPVMDRTYFKSIYFREPGGVLFEIATDGPGFAVDEDLDHLGSSLKLPDQFELLRRKIEKLLPPLNLARAK